MRVEFCYYSVLLLLDNPPSVCLLRMLLGLIDCCGVLLRMFNVTAIAAPRRPSNGVTSDVTAAPPQQSAPRGSGSEEVGENKKPRLQEASRPSLSVGTPSLSVDLPPMGYVVSVQLELQPLGPSLLLSSPFKSSGDR